MNKRVKVNSFHNYEIEELNNEFSPIATNEDKYVESFYSKKIKNFMCNVAPRKISQIQKL